MKYKNVLQYLIDSIDKIGISITDEMIELDVEDENEYRLLIRLPLNMGIIFTMNKKQDIDEIFVYGLEEKFGNIDKNSIDKAIRELYLFYQSCLQVKYFDMNDQEQGVFIFQIDKKPTLSDINNIWKYKIIHKLKYESIEEHKVVLKDYTAIKKIEVTYKLDGISVIYKVVGNQIEQLQES